MADYQDHHYPSEMAVDAMIQTFLMDDSENAVDTFLERFDTEWVRYNRDLIAKVQKFYEEHPDMLAAEPEQETAPAETVSEEEPASDTSEGGDEQ